MQPLKSNSPPWFSRFRRMPQSCGDVAAKSDSVGVGLCPGHNDGRRLGGTIQKVLPITEPVESAATNAKRRQLAGLLQAPEVGFWNPLPDFAVRSRTVPVEPAEPTTITALLLNDPALPRASVPALTVVLPE